MADAPERDVVEHLLQLANVGGHGFEKVMTKAAAIRSRSTAPPHPET
jgi:hypothetical protein